MAKQESLYGRFAKYYDRLYLRKKDYVQEAGFIDSLVRKHNPNAKAVLDVACGTGIHMSLLRQKGYSVTGVDASSTMLGLARKKVGRAKLSLADMRTFRLGQQFDAVMCMFSTINYNLTYGDLKKTIANFYSHLAKNGVVVIDVGFFPQMWIPDLVLFDTYKDEKLSIARISKSVLVGKDGIADINMLFFVKDRGKIDFELDEHRLMLFDLKKVKRIMQAAGFSGIRIYDGYSMKPWTAKSKRAVMVGLKKR